MVAADIYELVEEHFGEPASPDLVLQVREGPGKTALDFGARYLEWVTTQKPRIAQKPERQLRPYIAGAYCGPKGVSLYAPAFSNDENQLWALYDGLVHHLLYCHSVAIENPLMHLITSRRQYGFLSLQQGMFGFHINPKPIFSRYIALLVALRGLVDCGAVMLVETGQLQTSGFAPHVTVYREADPPGVGTHRRRDDPYVLSDAQFAQIQERVGAQLAERAEADLLFEHPKADITDDMRQRQQQRLLTNTLGEIVRGVRVSDRVGDLDVYLRNDWQQNALAHALTVAPEWLAGPSPSSRVQRQMRLLDRLLRIDLPDLSNLAPGDIRAIRGSDETFNRWRHALSNGLSSVETPLDVPLTVEQVDTIRGEIYENIVEAGLAINTSINKSDVMKAGKAGLLTLIVGSLISLIPGAQPAAMRAGLTGASKLGEAAFSKMRQKPLAESIDRHTVLFAASE
ncbi:hypothetical protein [Streptomyces sp. SD15]